MDVEASRVFPQIPYLTLRLAGMACVFFEAPYCLSMIREDHAAFYKRIYKARAIGEARPYAGVINCFALLYQADVLAIREQTYQRFPFFRSTRDGTAAAVRATSAGRTSPADDIANCEILPRRGLTSAAGASLRRRPISHCSSDGLVSPAITVNMGADREQCGSGGNEHDRGGGGRRNRHISEISAAQCRAARRSPRHAPQGFRHLAELDLARAAGRVRALALGLQALGLSRGDKVAVIGANRPRLYWTFAAAQSLGAVPVPVYADAVADEMAYVLDHAGVRFAVVQDQEQVDKIQSCAERIPTLQDRHLRRTARPCATTT